MIKCKHYWARGYDGNVLAGDCFNTKNVDTCYCGGDASRCDFFPGIRNDAQKTTANPKIIAVDFDGTLCENKWPEIGTPKQNVIDYIKAERAAGSKIILWTCREGMDLAKAIIWCMKRDICFDEVNENLPEIIEEFGSDRRKIFAHEYIDDKAVLPETCMEVK